MAIYTLPDMPCDYAALEPAITGEILELHHVKHRAAYVKGANDTLEQLSEAREKEVMPPLVGLEKTLAFSLSGHVLHMIFWQDLSYYLQYRNVRPDYVQRLWDLINWGDVAARYTTASTAPNPLVVP